MLLYDYSVSKHLERKSIANSFKVSQTDDKYIYIGVRIHTTTR